MWFTSGRRRSRWLSRFGSTSSLSTVKRFVSLLLTWLSLHCFSQKPLTVRRAGLTLGWSLSIGFFSLATAGRSWRNRWSRLGSGRCVRQRSRRTRCYPKLFLRSPRR